VLGALHVRTTEEVDVERHRGFTLVEVQVAIVVLTIGLIGLVSSSAMVSRMLGVGKIETRAARLAVGRMEMLRQAAYGVEPRCSAADFTSGSEQPSPPNDLSQSWTVEGTGTLRIVRVSVGYATVRGMRAVSISAGIRC
jgi:prepilin-type N-terminal cleavage/methylation domain-containing protein